MYLKELNVWKILNIADAEVDSVDTFKRPLIELFYWYVEHSSYRSRTLFLSRIT